MKIKVPTVQEASKQEIQWRLCRDHFDEYMAACSKQGVSHSMLLQATADCLAHLLVRHTNNTQAIISVMGATIARHEGLRREMVKKK